MERTESYLLWQLDAHGIVSGVGALALIFGANERLNRTVFRYRPGAPRLDPRHGSDVHTFEFSSNGRSLPGFIDDCLPDDWGRKVIAARLQKRFLKLTDVLNHSGEYASLGAVKILPSGVVPTAASWDAGLDIDLLTVIADRVWDGELAGLECSEAELLMVIRGGSQAGGARPKLIVSESHSAGVLHWLVKFNRSSDRFNYARMEWACLELGRRALLPVPVTQMMTLPSGRMGLKVERFDVTPDGGRRQLLTFNSLLKNEHDQDDSLTARYEDLARIIRLYSYRPKEDLRTLFGQMLLNMAVRNTDDHLRNFSLVRDARGWCLSPVYDVVPDEDLATLHQLSCLGSQYLPDFDGAEQAGKRCFGLSLTDSRKVIHNVREALADWPEILVAAGMDAADVEFASRVVRHVAG